MTKDEDAPTSKKQKQNTAPAAAQQRPTPTPKPPNRKLLFVAVPPIPRPAGVTLSSSPLRSFSIMTFNILAQCLVRRELFPYCTKSDLRVKHRFPLIVDDITQKYKPDIACLQEVDGFEDLLAPNLVQAGYDWVYLKKNPEKQGGHGLCIAWKKDKFSKQKYQSVFYDESTFTHPTPVTPVTNNIGQILGLRFHEAAADGAVDQGTARNSVGIVVTNTHLYWRPPAQYEKLRQAYVLLEEAVKFRREMEHEQDMEEGMSEERGRKWPLLLCGDWNSVPSDGVYRTLTKQPLTDIHIDKLNPVPLVVKTTPADRAPPAESSETAHDAAITPEDAGPPLENPLPPPLLISRMSALPRLHSCYATYRATDPSHTVNPDWKDGHGSGNETLWDGEPTYTNFTEWKGTLDYIFVAEESEQERAVDVGPRRQQTFVVVDNVLEIPREEYLQPGIPNQHFPSDHVPLMAGIGLYEEVV
ncbi:hypothetical protein HK104_001253 [Borealophlyctis nickersoniae]|nr:hypothetical protein HK104_001253 [Borealophlyctis nickersoniae]